MKSNLPAAGFCLLLSQVKTKTKSTSPGLYWQHAGPDVR